MLTVLRLSLLSLFLWGAGYEFSVVPEEPTTVKQSDPDETEVDPEYR